MSRTLISVSTHPAKNQLNNYIRQFEAAGVDMFHCDVMDGVFVEDVSFNTEIFKQLKSKTTLPLDVHLMVDNALEQAKFYCENGANIVTVHYESFKNKQQLIQCIQLIKNSDVLAGISIKPDTQVSEIADFLTLIDLVLVMSVQPGKSGQTFMPQSHEKVKQLFNLKTKNNFDYLIEVDGGINNQNAADVVKAGANILVSGSYIYNSNDFAQAVNSLRVNN